MTNRIDKAGLKVAAELARFVDERVLPGTGLEAGAFWSGMAQIFARFAPRNRELLAARDALQAKIDAWHADRAGKPFDAAAYEAFLREIGYLVPEPAPFKVSTTNVDAEIASSAGPQLVVPVLNARFVLNAANARWGSLYDALYGTDALAPPQAGGYDTARGAKVIGWAKAFLDKAAPLASGSWTDWKGGTPALADPAQLVGTNGANFLLKNNGLHIELVIDPTHRIGKDDPAGLADIVLESALTTIVDLEDSIAAVDAEDKVAAYANWLGLMNGTLEDTFEKAGKPMTRRLNSDRNYTAPDGTRLTLPGRSLLFVRNVGHLMTNPAILLPDGSE
ncbi:MAG: malate synthase G, partial [Rhabdaerophilum sp.]